MVRTLSVWIALLCLRAPGTRGVSESSVGSICAIPALHNVNYTEDCEAYRRIAFGSNIELEVMQQEYESLQVLVRFPVDTMVKVSTTVGMPSNWSYVGYVFTKHTPRYADSGGGWRPDPLFPLEGGGFVRVPANFLQPLWLTLFVDVDSPVEKTGEIIVEVTGTGQLDAPFRLTRSLPITVKVGHARAPSLFEMKTKHFWEYQPGLVLSFYEGRSQSELEDINIRFKTLLRQNRMPPVPADLGDYRSRLAPQTEFQLHLSPVVDRACKYVNRTALAELVASTVKKMEAYRFHGWPVVYGYGMDESPPACEPALREVYAALKQGFRDMRIMAATNWPSKVFNSSFPMDARIVQYQLYDDAWAREWLSAPGKELFGYHCIEPSAVEFPNSYIERPLIDNKLMFWYAASTRMSGWLYWSVDHMEACPQSGHAKKTIMMPGNATHPAFTSFDPADVWDCAEYPHFWQDGTAYVYPGEQGPLSTMRLEVTRDGIEDWEMLLMLPEQERKGYIERIIQKPNRYTTDPALMHEVRREALRAINAHLELLANVEGTFVV